MLDWLAGQAKRVSRIGSICNGAMLLAAAGLLDGRDATTFPSDRPELQKRYPSCKVKTDQRVP